jgi:hypothetical protein
MALFRPYYNQPVLLTSQIINYEGEVDEQDKQENIFAKREF